MDEQLRDQSVYINPNSLDCNSWRTGAVAFTLLHVLYKTRQDGGFNPSITNAVEGVIRTS